VSRRLAALVPLIVVCTLSLGVTKALGAPSELFISEYVEGTSNNKALEIYNGTSTAVNLTAGGYGLQFFFNGSTSAGTTISLNGTIAAGDVFVVAHTLADAAILADFRSSANFYNGNDAVALVKVVPGVGLRPVDVIGQIGFDPGAMTGWGAGTSTTTLNNTLRRKPTIEAGDTDGSDPFVPSVEWDGFGVDVFAGLGSHPNPPGDAAPSVTSTTPPDGATGVALDGNVSITFSEDVNVSGSWYAITCGSSGAHAAVASGGPGTFTLDPSADFVPNETCTVTISAGQVTDVDTADPPDAMAADFTFSFSTTPPIRIHDIQGSAHISPLNLQNVVGIEGIVTARSANGFWMQDPAPDASDATSEGIFVFTTRSVAVGDSVLVSGRAVEFRPGGSGGTNNLTTTEIDRVSALEIVSSGNALPAATVLGDGGRIPPSEAIEDDATGSVETSGVFDPATDGIDFYESVEGMRVHVNDAVATGPTNQFGEIPVVGDAGANAGPRTVRDGVIITPTDFNPERIILDDTLLPTPLVNVGDGFTTAALGVMDYSFGNFKLNVTAALERVDNGLEREVTRASEAYEITVATYNVENLDPSDGSFARHADLIVNHLRSPDVIAIEEIQDNDGAANTAVTDATVTWTMLTEAIAAAGGPHYDFRQIDPVDDQDGGEPGGNIRVGFLVRSDHGVHFIDRPGGGPTTPTTVLDLPEGPQLSSSPGRIDPADSAWASTRKSLAAEVRAHGKKLFLIANHFSSKGGDQPLFGRFQPPARVTEIARHAQAQVVNDFVDEILAADPNANIVVLGDINDFDFSETVEILEGGVLTTLMRTLPLEERYSYVFEGNSQVLDQILVSDHLGGFPIDYDPVHVNSEFADQASDHDPQVARLDLRGLPGP
jgi:predicted extracellular nuclease